MYDINKYIVDRGSPDRDPAGHLGELAHWSPRVAHRLAEAEGLMLSEDHWQFIYCLRERFCETGPDWSARRVTREMARDFAPFGGLRYLYALFPQGPLAQGCRFAGVPLPHGTVNRSFGSVH
jgi:tRNA 2-thiouridine synthesizing protein E